MVYDRIQEIDASPVGGFCHQDLHQQQFCRSCDAVVAAKLLSIIVSVALLST
jgi:hypothetical protein